MSRSRLSSAHGSIFRVPPARYKSSAAKAIPDAANCLEARGAQLLAQVAQVHVDHVRAVLVFAVPRPLEQLIAAQHLIRMAHEDLEQLELLRGERNLRAAPAHAARRRVQLDVGD